MKLFKNKVWSWWDIGLLKWCCLLYGIIVGAYLQYVLPYGWIILALAVIFTIRPVVAYWKD